MSSQYCRFVARGTARGRAPLLEQLLARADHWVPVTDWRADAFHVISPQATRVPAVGPVALCADGGAVHTAAVDTGAVHTGAVHTGAVHTAAVHTGAGDAAWVCVATPVHYVADMASVRLPADGMLTLTPAAAESLASDFNRVWQGSGIRLAAGGRRPRVSVVADPSATLFCIFDRALEVVTRDPEDVLDRHIEEFLPAGADAAPLRQLISETEMWLFEHAANRLRSDVGLPVINGLWFWGGGAPIATLPAVQGWCAGDDLFFNAFSAARNEKSPSGVVAVRCVPGADRWREVESRWLRPALELLRTRKIQRLEISAADRCYTLTAGGLRRFWRRKKPWWESFE